ncbi:acyltransferase family protein [Novosphingobium kaempferiae]|uniref:acyltransferase family protein n=1 Tax=Novosphingobium kaempferiae TaxID=2896849 RepID=UPI001E2F3A65|nr:acyltransferase [Novosphingobium kaempferiae]
MTSNRLAPLDGLRGLAACGVAFLYHAKSLFSPAAVASIPQPFAWAVEWGWTLVDLFFLISGYIFAHVYLQGDGLARGRLGDFALARFARLYPLHLVMLVACALLLPGEPGNTPHAFFAHLAMMQQFVQPVGHTFDGPAWSISVEVICYVIFAMAAVRGPRVLRWTSVAAMLVAVGHFALQGRAGGPWVGDGVPRGLLGFFLGQMLWQARARLAAVPTGFLVATLVLGLTIDTGTVSSLLPLTLLAWPALLLLALRFPALGSRPMLWLGDRSYAIYLVHYPLILLLERWHGPFGGGLWTVALVTASYTAVVLVLSDLSFRFVEGPARRAIRAGFRARLAVPEAA